jgi:HEAT repeat protein
VDFDCVGLEFEPDGRKQDDPDDFPVLLEAVKDKSIDIRASAAGCLGSYKNPQVLPTLVKLLASDPDPKVRAIAAESLGDTGDPAAIPPLKKAGKDKSADVRKAASKALARLKGTK